MTDPKDCKPGEVYAMKARVSEGEWVGVRNDPRDKNVPWQLVRTDGCRDIYVGDDEVSDLVRLVPARDLEAKLDEMERDRDDAIARAEHAESRLDHDPRVLSREQLADTLLDVYLESDEEWPGSYELAGAIEALIYPARVDPVEDKAVAAFKEAWHAADKEGDEGNRTRRGIAAARKIIEAGADQ